MSVASMNPFALLDETLPRAAAKPAVAPAATAVKTAKAPAPAPLRTPAASTAATRELNADLPVGPKSGENTRRQPSVRAPVAGDDRADRRRTDRHSRDGRKVDTQKRQFGGKASWGKAEDAAEAVATETVAETTIVEESAAIAAAVDDVPATPAPVHITLAQYQAALKKPAAVAALAGRTVDARAGQAVIKKADETFVFPEIVRKAAAAKPEKKAEKKTIDVSKYISIKSVSSTTEAAPARKDRDTRDARPRDNGDRAARPSKDRAPRVDAPAAAAPAAPVARQASINLKDARAFPALGAQ